MHNVSKSKASRTIKFGQSVVSIMRNILLKKLYTKCGKEYDHTHFLEKSRLSISLDQQSEILISFFVVCPN